MVNITFPSADPALQPAPVPTDSKKARNWERLIYYVGFVLLVVLAITGLWYVQASGTLLR